MGWKYEVQEYLWVAKSDTYYWSSVYTGESLFKAYRAMRKAKKSCGAVRLTWRG